MPRWRRLSCCLAVTLLFTACAGQPSNWQPERSHTVEPNDTVYSIAFRNGIDWRELARWNGIEGPRYLIRVGDELRLTPPRDDVPQVAETRPSPAPPAVRRPAPPVAAIEDVRFIWPADGELVARFDDPHASGKGIAIAGRDGQPVRAAAPGRVVYAGSGLIGYGRLIIVKHSNQVLSAYAHNREILAREGVGLRGRPADKG
jgi:lipoprotein NlpD